MAEQRCAWYNVNHVFQRSSRSSVTLPPYQLITSQQLWQSTLQKIKPHKCLAIDLESNSLFAYREEVCLIQLSTADQDFIIDPKSEIDLRALGEIIQDPLVEKVFHAAEYDCILLSRQYGWKLTNLFDTMWAARILGYERFGLAGILEDEYGVKLNKRHQKANWCKRPLSMPLLNYAQMDTHFLIRLRDNLATQLENHGRTEEAREIFAEQTRVRTANKVFEPNGFWSIRGVRDLSRAQQAIVRALYVFRDDQAKRQNRPHFKIFGDQTIVELAKIAPVHPNEINRIYGMSTGQVRRYGRQLARVIRKAKSEPYPAKPERNSRRPPDDVKGRYERLHLWRKKRAQLRGVESDVVVSRETLWELAWSNPVSSEDLSGIKSLGPWRRNTYGEEIMGVLDD